MTDTQDARSADKFVVRLKQGQRARLKERAKAEQHAMNDIVVVALDRYLEQGDRFDKLMALLERATKPQTDEYVTIKLESLKEIYSAASKVLPDTNESLRAASATIYIFE
jgi:hypothetical protein